MRLLLTIGRMTILHISLFEIMDMSEEKPDVVVVHHYEDNEDKPDEPDMFGNK